MSGDCIGVHRQNKSARHPGGVGGGAEHVVRRSSLWFGSSLESPVQRTHTVTVASKRSLPPVNRRCSRSGVLTLCVIARDGALSGAGWRVSEGAWNTTKSNMAGLPVALSSAPASRYIARRLEPQSCGCGTRIAAADLGKRLGGLNLAGFGYRPCCDPLGQRVGRKRD